LAVPLSLIYAFVCLSAWYTCRSVPPANSGSWLAHFAAAAVASLLWIAAARVLAFSLAGLSTFTGLDQQIARTFPILFGSGVLLYLLAVALYYVLLADQAATDADKRSAEARVLARESELKALKTQVNPHFIFNCLNSISALTSSDPAKAREMCVLLAEFLRKTLGLGEQAMIPLRDELALLHAYLSVEQIRFSSRLKIEENTAAVTLDNLLPPLLLQPLVENAVRHGVAQLTEGGWIRIDIQQPEPESLSIAIENNFDPEAPRRKGSGIGLRNVRERLDASYGNRARFDVRANHDRFLVSLNLPSEKES
jgi:LytS/YehU family sensor histidine kinase